MRHRIPWNLQLLQNLVVAFEYLDRVPSLLFFGQAVNCCLLDMGQRVFHWPGKSMHGNCLAMMRGIYRCIGSFHDSGSLESGDFDNRTSELPR